MRGATLVTVSTESSDHYSFLFPGLLSDDEVKAKINDEMGDEADYTYVEGVEHYAGLTWDEA